MTHLEVKRSPWALMFSSLNTSWVLIASLWNLSVRKKQWQRKMVFPVWIRISFSSLPAGDIQIIPPQKLGGYAGEGRLTLGASAGGVGLLLSRLSFSELVPFSDWFAGKVWLAGSDPDSCIWTSRTWEGKSEMFKCCNRPWCTWVGVGGGGSSTRADPFCPWWNHVRPFSTFLDI